MLKHLWIKRKVEIIGALIGSLIGIGYWYFVGCSSGTCAITSNPYISTGYGAITGALLAGIFTEKKIEKQTNN